MKTIKLNGIELLEMIKRNEMEMYTKINVYYDDVFRTTLTFDGYNLNWEAGTFKIAYLYDGLCHFEIVENKPFIAMSTQNFVAKTDTQDVKYDLLLMFGDDCKIYTIDTYNKTIVEKTKED